MLTVTFGIEDFPCGSVEDYVAHWKRTPREEGRFYVYTFRDAGGQVFYIGKGTGDRAYDRKRHRHGQLGYYVAEFLGGQYDVQVLCDHLTEQDAGELESHLITRLGKQLVNWHDVPTAGIDYPPVRARVSALRAEARTAARSGDLEHAVDLCQSALNIACEWELADREQRRRDLETAAPSSLLARIQLHELCTHYVPHAPACAGESLSDLTIYLCKLNRPTEAQQAIDRFAHRFPHGSFSAFTFTDHRYETPLTTYPTQRELATLRRVQRALRRQS